MDPSACLRLMVEAIRDRRLRDAKEHWQDLRDWVSRGGFMPAELKHESAEEAFCRGPTAYVRFIDQQEAP